MIEMCLIILTIVGIVLYNLVKRSYNSDKPDNQCTFFPEGNWVE